MERGLLRWSAGEEKPRMLSCCGAQFGAHRERMFERLRESEDAE